MARKRATAGKPGSPNREGEVSHQANGDIDSRRAEAGPPAVDEDEQEVQPEGLYQLKRYDWLDDRFLLRFAPASSAYLTVSEIFPLEIPALAITFFYAIGTINGPLRAIGPGVGAAGRVAIMLI